MSAKSEKILRDFTQALTKPKGTTPYDTTAKVLRVENGIAWVHIAGGVDETPVKMTIDAKAGDTVQVRVSGGRAFLVGNATAPPTDDATANVANKRAVNADKKAGVAKQTAEEAQETADVADGKATEAKEIAEEAGEAVAEVAQHFWTDEDGAHITEVTQEEYIDDPENAGSNTLLDSGNMYIRDGLTNRAVFGLMTRIGEEDKARIEITEDRFRQVTDSGVAAIDIQSSGATATEKVIRQYNTVYTKVPAGTVVEGDQIEGMFPNIALGTYAGSIGSLTLTIGRYSKTGTFTTKTETYNYPLYGGTIDRVTVQGSGDSTVEITLMVYWYDNKLILRTNVENSYATAKTIADDWQFKVISVEYDTQVEIPSIELNGEITFKKPTQVFVVENYTKSGVSVNNYTQTTINCTKAGYYPLAIVGWHSSSSYTGVAQCCLTNKAVGSCTIDIYLNNTTSSARTTNISYDVLWVKAE